jgi:hypothetical protein
MAARREERDDPLQPPPSRRDVAHGARALFEAARFDEAAAAVRGLGDAAEAFGGDASGYTRNPKP